MFSSKSYLHIGDVKADHPEWYFIYTTSIIYIKGVKIAFRIKAKYKNNDFCKMLEEKIEAEIAPIIKRCNGKSDYDKAMIIYDFLTSTVEYDKETKWPCHESFGPLAFKSGVCDGYAKAFKLIADRAELFSDVVIGNTFYIGTEMHGHAWNIVRIENNYSYVDCTKEKEKNIDSLLISIDEASEEYEPEYRIC